MNLANEKKKIKLKRLKNSKDKYFNIDDLFWYLASDQITIEKHYQKNPDKKLRLRLCYRILEDNKYHYYDCKSENFVNKYAVGKFYNKFGSFFHATGVFREYDKNDYVFAIRPPFVNYNDNEFLNLFKDKTQYGGKVFDLLLDKEDENNSIQNVKKFRQVLKNKGIENRYYGFTLPVKYLDGHNDVLIGVPPEMNKSFNVSVEKIDKLNHLATKIIKKECKEREKTKNEEPTM